MIVEDVKILSRYAKLYEQLPGKMGSFNVFP